MSKKRLVKNLKELMDQKEEEYDKLARKHENGNARCNTLEVKATEIFSGVRQFLENYLAKGGANQI